MNEQLRAVLMVYIVALPGLWYARIAFSHIVDKDELRAWLSCWLLVTMLALLIGNFWFYLGALFVCIIVFSSKTSLSGVKIFFLLLCAAPIVEKNIPGLGLFEQLIAIGHYKVLVATALLPVVLKKNELPRLKFQVTIDRLVIALVLLFSVLFIRATTVTDSLRQAINLIGVIYLPYFAMSRALVSGKHIRELMVAYLLPMIGLSLLGLVEFWKWWHLYTPLSQIWDIDGFGEYTERWGRLRAYVTVNGGPIAFGYCIMIAMGFLLAIWDRRFSSFYAVVLFIILTVGLISSLSRGPWIGAGFMLLVFVSMSRSGLEKVRKHRFFVVLFLPLLLFYAMNNAVDVEVRSSGSLNYESEEEENIDYRKRLLEKSLIVISRYPLFGSVHYLDELAGMGLLQGQGIVDVVNVYLGFALEAGLVGLSIFVSIFVAIIVKLYLAIRALPEKEVELERSGRALLAVLVGVLVTIFTVSGVGQIPMLYWSLAGISVAYIRIASEKTVTAE